MAMAVASIERTKWYETNLMRRVQYQLLEAEIKLTERAKQEGFAFPCEATLSDSKFQLAFISNYNPESGCLWVWLDHAKKQDINLSPPLILKFATKRQELTETFSGIEQTIVSEHALILRLNRKLARENLRIRKTVAGTRARFDLGEFFVVDTEHNACSGKDIDLEAWGREYGVLAAGEKLEAA
jgi:hypothetical protein